MMVGAVNTDRELTLTLRLRGESAQADVAAIIDTGFKGALTLNPLLVAYLGCPLIGSGIATLADGSQVPLKFHQVEMEWDGETLIVEADTPDIDPLVGMELLYGHRMTVEAVEGGTISIEKL